MSDLWDEFGDGLAEPKFAQGRLAGMAADFAFVSPDGSNSLFRVGENGRLQWWSDTKCLAKIIAKLVWSSSATAPGDAPEADEAKCDTLTTNTGRPRRIISAPALGSTALASLKQNLRTLAESANTAVMTEAALKEAKEAKLAAKLLRGGESPPSQTVGTSDTLQRKASASSSSSSPSSASPPSGAKGADRRKDISARLLTLSMPDRARAAESQDSPSSITAPTVCMDGVLAELKSIQKKEKSGSSSSGGGVNVSGSSSSVSIEGRSRCSGEGILWSSLPDALNMTADADRFTKREGKKGDEERFERKRRQCDAFAVAVHALGLPDGTVVVDFGCGSCGLTLPLAWAFPHLNFVGVDLKRKSLELMASRAEIAGMTNVRTECRSIGGFDEPFGLAIALHACGQASDEALLQAVRQGAPYLIAPCCIGKVKFSFKSASRSKRKNPEQRKYADGQDLGFINRLQIEQEGSMTRLEYPRSKWLASHLGRVATEDDGRVSVGALDGFDAADGAAADGTSPYSLERAEELFAGIAASADLTEGVHGHGSSDPAADKAQGGAYVATEEEDAYHRTCATVMCLDRNAFASESAGYETRLCSMKYCATGKSDILVGWVGRGTSAAAAEID